MGPLETIDLNAPAGVRDYVKRYQGIYERVTTSGDVQGTGTTSVAGIRYGGLIGCTTRQRC
jgi:hypothetical protein